MILEDDARGGLRLEGRVVTADDAGVAAATVVIDTHPSRSVATEADGTFAFDGLLSRRYVLEATTPDGSAGPTTVMLRDTTEPVILHLRAGARLEVTVTDTAGAAIGGASVALHGLSVRSAVADARGAVVFEHLTPWRYVVAASAPAFAPEDRTVFVDGPTPVALRIALRRGSAVTGRVVTPDGEPARDATVDYEAASELTLGRPELHAVVTDASGRFRFAALPAGSFRFRARHAAFAPGSSAIVRLDGKTERDGIDIRLAPGATLHVRVETPAGAAVTGAAVRASSARASLLPVPARQAITDGRGELTLAALPRDQLQLIAVHDAGASDTQIVDLRTPPFERRLTLVLVHTASIAGVVVDAAGQPVEGAQVTARAKGAIELPIDGAAARLRGTVTELTDAGGRFTLTGLAQGRYELRASRRSARWALDLLRPATEAATGDTGVRLQLASDGTVTGRVAFASGEPPGPFVVALGGAPPTSVLSGSGEFTLSDVPPGGYRLAIRGPAFTEVQRPDIVVREGKTTELGTITVSRDGGGRITGVVVAGGNPVPGALVMIGSSILSDGTSIKMQGSPLAGASREATTGDDGRFTIGGLRAVPQVAVAEHPDLGRSAPVTLDGAALPADDLVLELHGFGSLRGKTTERGEPVSGISVGLQSMEANGLHLMSTTGSDGVYEFANLAPGRYKLSAMFGGMQGMGFHGTLVDVRSGVTTTADLALDRGTLALAITVTPTNAPTCRFAWINVVAGRIVASNAAELQTIVLRGDQSFSAFAVFSDPIPAVVPDLSAGLYTVCAIPFPKELTTQAEYSEYHQRAAAVLPVYCQAVQLTDDQQTQRLTLQVALPPFTPPPNQN